MCFQDLAKDDLNILYEWSTTQSFDNRRWQPILGHSCYSGMNQQQFNLT